MALGGGKYDSECTLVRERTNAEASIVIVLNGRFWNWLQLSKRLVLR